MGRKSTFNARIGAKICQRLAEGESLNMICKELKNVKKSTVIGWVLDPANKEFSEQYARARLVQAWGYADDIIEIADDDRGDFRTMFKRDGTEHTKIDLDNINRSRLMVDSRKWVLAKILPKDFGDKVEGESTEGAKELPPLRVTVITKGPVGE